MDPQRYWEAALRHVLAAWNNYKAVDQESGLPHIWHVACNLAFIMAMDDETKVPDWLGKACEVLGEIE